MTMEEREATRPAPGTGRPHEVHEHYMRLALREAALAADAGEVPTGCVIVERPADGAPSVDARILGRGHNETEGRGNPTAHAEMLAIAEACAARGDFRLTDTVLYVTKEPCAMCAGAIVLARIPLVVYGVSDPHRGGQSVFGILDSAALIHRAEVVSGVCGDECRDRLQAFFRARRAASVSRIIPPA